MLEKLIAFFNLLFNNAGVTKLDVVASEGPEMQSKVKHRGNIVRFNMIPEQFGMRRETGFKRLVGLPEEIYFNLQIGCDIV